jgi:hypothetical protein
MNRQQIEGIVRHIVGGIGAYLVGRGKLDPEQVELWVGLALAALAVFWSYQAKKPVQLKPAE